MLRWYLDEMKLGSVDGSKSCSDTIPPLLWSSHFSGQLSWLCRILLVKYRNRVLQYQRERVIILARSLELVRIEPQIYATECLVSDGGSFFEFVEVVMQLATNSVLG